MVYLLKTLAASPARPVPPERRRTIIIGGGPTGISAAFHLGEHSLLLERRASLEDAGSPRALVPLLRGELRFGANVVLVSPSLHMLELADGTRFVYDKLLSTVPMTDLADMVMHDLASRISHAEFLRFWLAEHDIEVVDRATQFCQGDVDEMAAGKRVAEYIHRALAGRFQARHRGSSFFVPRLVEATATATP